MMNNLLTTTFSSMNYLFLKTIINQVNDEHVNIELQNYLIELNSELKNNNVSNVNTLKEIIETEMVDGDYFYTFDNDINKIKHVIKEKIVDLSEASIDELQPVYNLYMDCIKNVLN